VSRITSEKMERALRLKDLRENMNFTQEEFANKLNISLSAYKKIEGAENNISVNILGRLRNEMNISADYVLFGENKDLDNAWYSVQNCTEKDKLILYGKLMLHFLKTTCSDEEILEREAKDIIQKIMETK